MFLRDVHMDGFKCYTDKISMKNLDKNFTAITGMNGSGKSNIIDAIVFTLDLNTSKYMRVANLKELINIHRKDCSVSLVFDNRDKASVPPGYESYDEIEITRMLDHEGKSKYKINNHNSTKSSIESFCKSIGITNNFIVLQGQITKIVNMKSVDLKNMIEETAGTRSYSIEREKSLELLSKKEFKLKEAREHLKKTISPFYDQLRKEKQLYEENKDFEENRKHFIKSLKCLEGINDLCYMSEQNANLLSLGYEYFNEIQELKRVETDLKCSELEQVSDKISIENRLNQEVQILNELKNKNFQDLVSEKEAQIEKYVKCIELGLKYNLKELKEKEAILSREILSNSDFNRMSDLENLRNTFFKIDLKYKNLQSDFLDQTKNFYEFRNKTDNEISNIIKENSKSRNELLNELRTIEPKMFQLKSKIIYPVIDGVYGTVDENFTFVSEKYKTAIMTILGGKAKYILTRDEDVALKVLQSSDRKVSCIPLSKITYYESSKIPYNCINALQAVVFEKKYEKAFKHLLNSFYIFEDKGLASKCCFEQKVVCVTLQGDVYDPRGTLTGGKAQFKYDVTHMSEILKLEQRIAEIKEKTSRLDAYGSLEKMILEKEALYEEVSSTRGKLEILEKLCGSKIDVRSELESLRNLIVKATKEDNSYKQAQKVYEQLSTEIKELNIKYNENVEEIRKTDEKIAQLNMELQEWKVKDNKRKASLKMRESVDEQRKTLIKSSVKKSGRIVRIYEEIKPKIKETLKSSNHIDSDLEYLSSIDQYSHIFNKFSGYKSYGTVLDNFLEKYPNAESLLYELESQFGIDKSIFNIPHIFTLTEAEKTILETEIHELRAKSNQKRLMISMDPSNFELLEKNSQAIESLKEKIEKLEVDRNEIVKSIEQLNKLGINENKKAFDHINKVMRVFLGYFLPQSDVLITEDFELKIKVGEWKNSLSELSGGQRSLIALCLIFSMLTFKPAPFYIFDEIDAALDLNYTQSIGEIIKKEFNGAQFIVVSLKNNMFDSANRIFKVFIQDHRSKVCLIK